MFLHTASLRGYTTIPSTILDDNRISIGAKGLYIQLFYSNKSISSLEDVTKLTTSTKEELDNWFKELANVGYIIVKNNRCDLVAKTQGEKTVAKKLDEEAVEAYTETVTEKKPNAYEIMIKIINSYDLPNNVKQLLTTYFENWLNRKGRYVDADQLHGNKVRLLIGELISFHVSEKTMISIVQNSIDHEYFKFFVPEQPTNTTTKVSQFDKSNITSGSFTQDDIKAIRERAAAMEADGKKGTF